MTFVYENMGYQFATMNNTAAFVMSNPSYDNLIDIGSRQPYEAISDFFSLQTHLQNLSLVSLLNDFGPANSTKQTYVIALALEPSMGLYEVATEEFYPTTGIYRSEKLREKPWYMELNSRDKQAVWWVEEAGVQPLIFVAQKKTSFRNGQHIGTVLVGADISGIKGVMNHAPIEKGYHILLDESGRVIYSDSHAFMQDLSGTDLVRSLEGSSGSITINVKGERQIELYDTFENGWKVLTFVPEGDISRDTTVITMAGVLIGALGLIAAGFMLRRIVIKVSVPINRLVSAMQRPDILEGKEPLPSAIGGIYEVNELYSKFTSMLVVNRELAEKAYRDEISKRQLQLELLQLQINPHFLYNTLDLINCRAILSGDQDSSKLVRSLANVFRYGLNKGNTWITLDDEVRQVSAYLDIQTMMLADLKYEIEIPPTIKSTPVVHLILQPLAENCIVHGFSNRTEQCRIRIRGREEEGMLVLRVEDNGQGANAESLNGLLAESLKEQTGNSSSGGSSGYGTFNVHRRIKLHCGEPFGLRYVAVPEGTCVEAVVPLLNQS